MSEFNFDDIIDSVRNGAIKAKDGAEKLAKGAVDKTGMMMSQMRLQYAIKNVKSKIEEAFLDIGRHIYDEFADEDIEGPIKDKCDHVKGLYDELKTLNDELAALKNTVLCEDCGNFNSTESRFCSVCGAPLKHDNEE